VIEKPEELRAMSEVGRLCPQEEIGGKLNEQAADGCRVIPGMILKDRLSKQCPWMLDLHIFQPEAVAV
jgi:hypothetical protein